MTPPLLTLAGLTGKTVALVTPDSLEWNLIAGELCVFRTALDSLESPFWGLVAWFPAVCLIRGPVHASCITHPHKSSMLVCKISVLIHWLGEAGHLGRGGRVLMYMWANWWPFRQSPAVMGTYLSNISTIFLLKVIAKVPLCQRPASCFFSTSPFIVS